MPLARFSLAVSALAFAGFGVWLLVVPEALGALGIELTTPSAAIEIRGFYGGLELGIALFFAWSTTRPGWYRPALFAQVATLGGVVFGRLVGIVVDGSAIPLIYQLMAFEIAGALLGIVALTRLPRALR